MPAIIPKPRFTSEQVKRIIELRFDEGLSYTKIIAELEAGSLAGLRNLCVRMLADVDKAVGLYSLDDDQRESLEVAVGGPLDARPPKAADEEEVSTETKEVDLDAQPEDNYEPVDTEESLPQLAEEHRSHKDGWTKERIAYLVEATEANIPAAIMADIMEVSEGALKAAMTRVRSGEWDKRMSEDTLSLVNSFRAGE